MGQSAGPVATVGPGILFSVQRGAAGWFQVTEAIEV
jgi:hypothetical protein